MSPNSNPRISTNPKSLPPGCGRRVNRTSSGRETERGTKSSDELRRTREVKDIIGLGISEGVSRRRVLCVRWTDKSARLRLRLSAAEKHPRLHCDKEIVLRYQHHEYVHPKTVLERTRENFENVQNGNGHAPGNRFTKLPGQVSKEIGFYFRKDFARTTLDETPAMSKTESATKRRQESSKVSLRDFLSFRNYLVPTRSTLTFFFSFSFYQK